MGSGIYWPTFFFWLFSLVVCAFALAVVMTSNIVRMAFYLTLSLGATAGLFFLAGADFVGSMQLLIYVGGTLVLLVFGVMLTAQVPFISMRTRAGDWILTALVALPLLGILAASAFSIPDWQPLPRDQAAAATAPPTATRLGLGLLGARVDQMQQQDAALVRGMSGYLLPFEIVSVHLLVVLIGAAYLARAKRRRSSVAQT